MSEIKGSLIPQFRIDGTLTTLGPLRIGDGGVKTDRIPLTRKKEAVEVSTVFVDSTERAYLPGTSLKGFLRGYFAGLLVKDELNALFGFQDERSAAEPRGKGLGGALTVWDARVKDGPLPNVVGQYWSRRRVTCVAPHVRIDRCTRTAKDQLLFHEEFVPEGVTFDVTLLLEGGPKGWVGADAMETMLAGLNELKHFAARMGACNASGWGHLDWRLGRAREQDGGPVRRWLNHPGSLLIDHMGDFQGNGTSKIEQKTGQLLEFEVKLRMKGPFLVNDPSLAKHDKADRDKADHAPVRDAAGMPVLPGSSFHGALRSQAERIARTIKRGDLEKEPIVKKAEDVRRLDEVSYLFGTAGWRSLLRVSELTLAPSSKATLNTQEFVAIDRFTGGGAEHLKFNAEGFQGTGKDGFVLEGSIVLDWSRVEEQTGPLLEKMLYLLAYTFRDLCEGDVPLGFGRAKGYGHCEGTVELKRSYSAEDFGGHGEFIQKLFAGRKEAA